MVTTLILNIEYVCIHTEVHSFRVKQLFILLGLPVLFEVMSNEVNNVQLAYYITQAFNIFQYCASVPNGVSLKRKQRFPQNKLENPDKCSYLNELILQRMDMS